MRVRDANQPVASYLGREGGSLGEERLSTIRAAHEMLERNLHCSSPHRTKAGPPPVRCGAPGGAVRTLTPNEFGHVLSRDPAVFVQPFRLTIALIQIGAKGDVQPFETG